MRISAGSSPGHARRCWRRPTGRAARWSAASARHVYWYRFTDDGAGSRVGRTITAPRQRPAPRPLRLCLLQSVNEGAQNAYRRMIWEDDARRPIAARLRAPSWRLHLRSRRISRRGAAPLFAHRLRHWPHSRRPQGGQFPRADHLDGIAWSTARISTIPDIQDARACFPFVCIGDNHEFSWQGWQSFIKYDGKIEPAQPLRVAANQAWWEYIPSRVRKASGRGSTSSVRPR